MSASNWVGIFLFFGALTLFVILPLISNSGMY